MNFKGFLSMNRLQFVALFALFLCANVNAQDLKLSLVRNGSDLVFSIQNHTNHNLKINTLFSMDPVLGTIKFKITRGGVVYQIRGQIDGDVPEASSYVLLRPGQFYGDSIDIGLLKKMYGIGQGCYSVRMFYEDGYASKFDAYSRKISSRLIHVCVK